MSEPFAYRENLEQILKFSEGRYPFVNGKISAATLARCMCGGGKQ